MKLSTQTVAAMTTFSPETAVKLIADAGFDCIDLSIFDVDYMQWIYEDGFDKRIAELRRIAEDCGVSFNQAHAPFPPYRYDDEEYNVHIRPLVVRAIEAAGLAGAKSIVVHPVVFPENQKENNMKMYNEMLPVAKRAGIKIAVENMWGRDPRNKIIVPNVCSSAEELADYVDSLDPDWFTVCLDIGHIGLVRDYEAPFIRALGAKRITCLHVHDNDYIKDLHMCPFTGNLPWKEITEALADIGYDGEFTLEADNFLLKYLPPEMYPAGLQFMAAAGRELIRMIEEAKK